MFLLLLSRSYFKAPCGRVRTHLDQINVVVVVIIIAAYNIRTHVNGGE